MKDFFQRLFDGFSVGNNGENATNRLGEGTEIEMRRAHSNHTFNKNHFKGTSSHHIAALLFPNCCSKAAEAITYTGKYCLISDSI